MKIIMAIAAMALLLAGCDQLPPRVIQQQPAPAVPGATAAPAAPVQAPAKPTTQVKPASQPTTEAPKPTTPRPATTEPVKTTRPATTTPTTKPTTTPATTTANVTAEDNLRYSGVVIAMGPAVWQVSDKAFTIDKDTDIGVGLKVGDRVEVRYREAPNGLKLARKIESR